MSILIRWSLVFKESDLNVRGRESFCGIEREKAWKREELSVFSFLSAPRYESMKSRSFFFFSFKSRALEGSKKQGMIARFSRGREKWVFGALRFVPLQDLKNTRVSFCGFFQLTNNDGWERCSPAVPLACVNGNRILFGLRVGATFLTHIAQISVGP